MKIATKCFKVLQVAIFTLHKIATFIIISIRSRSNCNIFICVYLNDEIDTFIQLLFIKMITKFVLLPNTLLSDISINTRQSVNLSIAFLSTLLISHSTSVLIIFFFISIVIYIFSICSYVCFWQTFFLISFFKNANLWSDSYHIIPLW